MKVEELLEKILNDLGTYKRLIGAESHTAIKCLDHISQDIHLVLDQLKTPLEHDIKLSPRENQVLSLICKGKLYKEIAYELSISEKTVQFHTKSIFIKLGVSSRTEAAVKAIELRIVSK